MKRRFRQKQDQAPKDDPEKDKGLTEDNPVENIDIANVIEEIEKHIEKDRSTGTSHPNKTGSRKKEQDIDQ